MKGINDMNNNKFKTLKNVINGCKSRYDITEITVIENTHICFSGLINKFEDDCIPTMIEYRNMLLNREVVSKDLIGGNKLFVFISPKED